MSALVICVASDSKPKRLEEFVRSAREVAIWLKADLVSADNASEIMRAINHAPSDLQTFVIVGHGTPKWILRPGRAGIFDGGTQYPSTVSAVEFAARLSEKLTRRCARVALAACSCARDPGFLNEWGSASYEDGGTMSIAATIRDVLVANDCLATVSAHVTVGHCTDNPCGRDFLPVPLSPGRSWLLQSGTENTMKTRRKWNAEVKGSKARTLLLGIDV